MNDELTNAERSYRAQRSFRVLLWVIGAAALVVFAVVNTQEVAVDWVFGTASTALWIVIAVSAVVGFLLGYVTRARR